MITDADIQKMKKVFATKDDLKNFATKDDLNGLAKQKDLLRLELKVDSIKQDVHDLTDAVGAIFQWTDNIHRAIIGKPSRKSSEN